MQLPLSNGPLKRAAQAVRRRTSMADGGRPRANEAGELWQAGREEFVQAHLKRIYVLIYRLVGNAADAQDLTQEVFIKALQRQEQLRDQEKAAHWLSRIATNTAMDHLRRRSRRAESDLENLPDPLPAPDEESPEDRLLRAERAALLEEGLSRLTPRERAALVLRDLEDLPAEQVARLLNCGKATVRSHIANARIKFRRYWEKRQP
jgi:RNA polymerase sigma-70 factor (ECF subfamily)